MKMAVLESAEWCLVINQPGPAAMAQKHFSTVPVAPGAGVRGYQKFEFGLELRGHQLVFGAVQSNTSHV